jgi:uncharacterized SAM-dependent methyltransferase
MEIWTEIAKDSYQTKHELEIINETAGDIVERFRTGATIIDLGAADSQKYVPFVKAFLRDGKICTYTPLDLNPVSLEKHVLSVRNSYTKDHQIPCVGLWGTFIHGDKYYHRIKGQRLFLSLGGIFFNAPEWMCHARLEEFDEQLRPGDVLLVGQDGPTSRADLDLADKAYKTEAYHRFVDNYLEVLGKRAGIEVVKHVREYWDVDSLSPPGKHYFKITARVDMVCTNLDNSKIKAGTSYEMFSSWKRTYEDIKRLVSKHDLDVTLHCKSPRSGMCQYLIQKKEKKPSAVA